ncbi:MAG: ROK family protein [Candidatus Omnitrophica bacterium]|nr:ROK family protein [Candidatus Omnitrophota bacterium]
MRIKKEAQEEMEKRQSPRLEKTLPVRFDFADSSASSRVFEALSRNIGEGGVFVETDIVQEDSFALDKAMVLNLEIELLGQARRLRLRGEIAWISKKSRAPQKKRNGFGVRFMQIDAEQKKAITLFISKERLTQAEFIEKEIPVISREQKLTDRQRRNLEILNAIRKNRLISRAEISKETGINIVTVSNYIDTYLKKGLVFERGLDISTGGRRPELVEINPQYGYVIGVDLGLLNTELASMQVIVTDFTSRVLAKAKEKRPDEYSEELLPMLREMIAKVIESVPLQKEKIRGIGVGISGIMDKFGGTVRNPLTLQTFANYVTIKKELEYEFDLPVFIENSASCALFAEKWAGVSLEVKQAENIIYVLSDNQCAIMIKGELYTGTSKSTGQLNFAVPKNGSSNGDYCWMNADSECIVHSRVQSNDVIHDPQESLYKAGMKMGAKIAYLVNIFNPQVVIIDSNFSQLGDIFLDTIRRTVNRWSFRENANSVRIVPATLREEASPIGVASLVIESAFANI